MQQLAWRSLAFFFLLSTLVACSGGSSGDDQDDRSLEVPEFELTLNGDEKITVEATTDYQELGATATDKQGNDLDVQIEGQVDTQALGTYTLIYKAEDSEGNTISATREITVVDTTAPELALQGSSNVTLEALTEFTDQGATAEDSFDGELNVTVDGTVIMNAVGTYTLTYSATDNSGNLGSIKRTVNVVDTNAPQITLNGESTLIWEAATEFVDPGVSAVDAVEGEPEVTVTGTVNTRTIGTYTLTYIAADSSGNKASVQREVSVVDTTAPQIKLTDGSSINWEAATSFAEPGYSVSDGLDGSLDVIVQGSVDITKLGSYTLTYSAMDNSGNQTSVQREVNVVDTTAPKLTLQGKSNVTLEALTEFTDQGATAEDSFDGELNVTVNGTVNTNAVGTYTITYSATDSSGNQASIQREVNVVDTTAPVISLNGNADMELVEGRNFIDPGAQAEDALEGVLSVSITGEVDINTQGQYQLTYSAQDSSGNSASVQRTVEVRAFRPFITTWQTDKPGGRSEDNQIRIQTIWSGADFTVDWGDGHVDENLSGTTTHTYDSAGEYQIKIYGNFPYIRHSSSSTAESKKLVSLDQWGDIRWQSMQAAFANAETMVYKATDVPDLSQVTNMSSMFDRAKAFNGDISQWDVSNVTDMGDMFRGAEAFNGDISQWDVSNVTDMSIMFYRAKAFNGDISQWDVSNVTNMRFMFTRALSFNGDISQWDVSSVTDMGWMFDGAKTFNGDLSQWDVSNVTSMLRMFTWATAFNSDISQWDVSNVTNMMEMFTHAGAFNSDISQWDVSNVTKMYRMFTWATAFNSDISQWDVSNVTDMRSMFSSARAFNRDVSQWDVSNVAKMTDMFNGLTLSSDHYDAILQSWSTLPLQSGVEFHGGNSQYSAASESARSVLQNTYGWTITDGGLVQP